ncbi:MAG: 4Fe-4S dicluster domain-containing protein [Zestosphaera sp.]
MGLQGKRLTVRPELCTGCSICELICSFTKFRVFNPRKSMVRIHYNHKLGRLEKAVTCSQCGACMAACPSGAIRRGNGVVIIDHSRCGRCLTCVNTCPEGLIQVVDGTPHKCDLCGGIPQCVRYCVRGALNVVS